MTPEHAILERLDQIESELEHTRRRARRWKWIASAAVTAAVLVPLVGDAGKAKQSIALASLDGSAYAEFTASGFEYRVGDVTRAKLDVGESWGTLTFYEPSGKPKIAVGTEETATAIKIFSKDELVRLELSDKLLYAGSGLQLYDDAGNPRVTLFSGLRGGESGLRLTDANLQPRVDIFAKPLGESVIRTSDSKAQVVAELSVLRLSDAEFRQLGMVGETTDHDPLVPMVYMLDATGTNQLLMPVLPH